jgi:hypothetical protein
MTIKKTLAALVLAGMIASLIAFTGTRSSVSAGGAEVAPELEGSWEVTVDPGPNQLLSLATFDRGGGMVVVNPNKHISTAHGNWVKTGPHDYAVTFVYILRNAAGEIDIGTIKIRSVIQLDPATETFSGPEQVIVTIGGTVVDSSCGIVQGKRISIEAPECS